MSLQPGRCGSGGRFPSFALWFPSHEENVSHKSPKGLDIEFRDALLAEEGAIKAYNAAIVAAGDVADFATREILEDVLKDEDRHIDKIEELQDQIKHMTVPVFLSTQLD